jgi:hypothetical protein
MIVSMSNIMKLNTCHLYMPSKMTDAQLYNLFAIYEYIKNVNDFSITILNHKISPLNMLFLIL